MYSKVIQSYTHISIFLQILSTGICSFLRSSLCIWSPIQPSLKGLAWGAIPSTYLRSGKQVSLLQPNHSALSVGHFLWPSKQSIRGPIFLHSCEKVLLSTYCMLSSVLDSGNVYKQPWGMSVVKFFFKISQWSDLVHLTLNLGLWRREILDTSASCMILGNCTLFVYTLCAYFHIILIKFNGIICVKYIAYSKWFTMQWPLLLSTMLLSYSTERLTHQVEESVSPGHLFSQAVDEERRTN